MADDVNFWGKFPIDNNTNQTDEDRNNKNRSRGSTSRNEQKEWQESKEIVGNTRTAWVTDDTFEKQHPELIQLFKALLEQQDTQTNEVAAQHAYRMKEKSGGRRECQ